MKRARREARIAVLLIVSLALVAGCSRAPKPKVVPADATKAATDSTKAAADSTKAAVTKKAGASTAAAKATTRNGASFPGTSAGSSTSAPAVVPQVSAAEQERLGRETTTAIEGAQKALDSVDATKLDAERARKHVIAKDFLAQANEALTRREYERAQGLAVKAKLLAEEIAAK
jgi:predicted amino acid dehydrogenase